MTRWIVAAAIGLLMLCEMLFSVSTVFAGSFDQLSPGNQKATRALFEAQRSDLPPGTTPLTLDQIAAKKQNGQGWGRVFADMKSRGLVTAKNFGQVVSSFDHRHHLSSASTMTTGANRTVGIGRDAGPNVSHGDSNSGHGSNFTQGAATNMQARAQAGGMSGVGHGRGK
jgi:hypothetical protein